MVFRHLTDKLLFSVQKKGVSHKIWYRFGVIETPCRCHNASTSTSTVIFIKAVQHLDEGKKDRVEDETLPDTYIVIIVTERCIGYHLHKTIRHSTRDGTSLLHDVFRIGDYDRAITILFFHVPILLLT